MALPLITSTPLPGPTLTKAVARATAALGINQGELGTILGLSKASISRLIAGTIQLEPRRRKEWEMAILFVRLFRSLDAVVGHGEPAHRWLRGPNLAIGRPPIEEITSAEGLVRVVQYLDAIRGRV